MRAATAPRRLRKTAQRRLRKTGQGRERHGGQRAREAHIGDYESAMFGVRHAVTDLETARQHGDPPSALRYAHGRIDEALARAAAAATEVYAGLFDAAGGMYHAETDPAVALWKRRMNTALTLRSQHHMAQVDEEAALPIAGARAHTRAAFGPQQAGLDFGVEHDATLNRMPAGSPI